MQLVVNEACLSSFEKFYVFISRAEMLMKKKMGIGRI